MSGIPTIGDVVREWRRYRQISLTDFCQQTELSKSYVSELEHNKIDNPKQDKLERLALALGISIMDIVSRQMPPGIGGGDDNNVGQPAARVAPVQQLPAVARIDGAVLQQILTQLQELKAVVAQLQADVAALQEPKTDIQADSLQETLERERQQTYHPSTDQQEDAEGLLPPTPEEQITGRWEGYAWQTLLKGTHLTLPEEIGGSEIEVARDMITFTAMRLTLQSSDDSQLSGNGQLDFDLHRLYIDFVKTVHVTITGARLEDGSYTFETQNIKDTSNQIHFSQGTLSKDGQVLMGKFYAMGFMTKRHVEGDFQLVKVREVPGDYEVIILETWRKIIDLLKKARHSILVTHFTTEIPPEDYISVMLQKLHKVAITRIVAFLPDAPAEVYSWLKHFRKRDGTVQHNYQEYEFPGTPLPSNLMVIDDEVAVQYFATSPDSSTFGFAICHYDSRIAQRFREYMEALIPNEQFPSSPAFLQELPRRLY